VIGDNVFIEINSIILQNVCIGDNVIVEADSIITKDIPDNYGIVKIPAKNIKLIIDYKTKVLKKTFSIEGNNQI
jgi:serine acetyltransferase